MSASLIRGPATRDAESHTDGQVSGDVPHGNGARSRSTRSSGSRLEASIHMARNSVFPPLVFSLLSQDHERWRDGSASHRGAGRFRFASGALRSWLAVRAATAAVLADDSPPSRSHAAQPHHLSLTTSCAAHGRRGMGQRSTYQAYIRLVACRQLAARRASAARRSGVLGSTPFRIITGSAYPRVFG